MPTYYKGAGLGTHWHKNDSRRVGFTARSPEATPTTGALITHVAAGTKDSPYISLTCSYAVAWDYAMKGALPPTSASPAYVYEIDIADAFVSGLILHDPVKELLPTLRSVIDTNFQGDVPFYQHNGNQAFLIEVANPTILVVPEGRHPQPPGPGEPCDANLTPSFKTLVNSLFCHSHGVRIGDSMHSHVPLRNPTSTLSMSTFLNSCLWRHPSTLCQTAF